MIFEYDETTRTAVDLENKIRIRMSSKFYDTGWLNYEYSDEHIEFVFAVFEAREKRVVSVGENAKERIFPIAMYMVEQTVKQGAGMWPLVVPNKQARYPEVRRAVEYGMFTLGTLGGKLLAAVPNYRVEFIPDFSNIPRLRF